MSTAVAALPFFGGELSSFDPSDGTVVEIASNYITTADGPGGASWARCSIQVPQPAAYFETPSWAGAATMWSHFVFMFDTGFTIAFTGQILADYLNGSTVVARITADYDIVTSSQTLYFWSLQSGTLVNNFSVTLPSAIQTFDMELISNTSGGGLQAVYIGGTSRGSATGLNHAAFTGWTQVKRYGAFSGIGNLATYWSEMIDDTTPTIGRRVYTARFDTPSAVNTGWTGTVSDINEVVLDDASFIFAASASLVDTFFQSGLNLGTFTILGVGVGARTRVQGSGPAHVSLVVRSGSTNYASTAIAVNTGFQACFNSWTTDPHTSAAWGVSAAAAAEQGVESVT